MMSQTTQSLNRGPWFMLPARTVFFFLFQALFAVGFMLAGDRTAWNQSAAWWPMVVTLTNLVCLYLLIHLYRSEGKRYWDLFRFDRQHLKGDLGVLFVFLLIAGPVSMLPNSLLATMLYGDRLAPMSQFIVPLPPVGLLAAVVLFPITQGLVELAVYFMYVMPRLAKQINPWLAYILASFFLGIQHAMIPLRFDGRFFIWRSLMFIPFAFLIGAILKWRPRMFPYLAVVHVLIDFATGLMYLIPL